MAFTLLNRLLNRYSFDQSGLLNTEGVLPHKNASVLNVTAVESFAQHLDLTGDGSGTDDVLADFSSTADIFFFTPAANKTYLINKIQVSIRDIGLANGAEFGALAALTNGITFKHSRDGDTVRDFTLGNVIKTNGDLADMCDEFSLTNYAATDENILLATFNFPEPLVISAALVDKLEYGVNDNFTGLVHHFVTVHGLEITTA